jgi:long-chain acyl-CoA synthetase
MTKLNYETTLVELFCQRVSQHGDRTALLLKRQGQYQAVSWNELAKDVRRFATAIAYYNTRPGDRVVQLAENRYEWIVTDLAIHVARGVHVPLHAPLTPAQIGAQIRNAEARLVFVSNAEQAQKLAACALPENCEILSYEPCAVLVHGKRVKPIAELAEAADFLGLEQRPFFEEIALREVKPHSLATILYTSGTTGEPKGVMLTQRNLVSNALAALSIATHEPGDVRLNFLPLSHIFARTCDLYTWLASESGTQLALAENRDTVVADCQAVRPTHLSAVPYFYDKIARGLTAAGAADAPGAALKLLGGRVRMLASGGAALPNHLFDFFQRQGLEICQGYGLTESSPVITINRPGAAQRGSAGRAIPDVEIRIADDGEILTRGPHVMQGYWQNESATREVIDEDGWLHTGDIGHLDVEGNLFITGRKKEIIVTAAGKNVAPVQLESLLTEDPLILQALVIGDDRSFLTALIVPNMDNVRAAATARGIAWPDDAAALEQPEVSALFETAIAQRLACVSHYEQVRRFALLRRGFTIESGELTPKLSLRRKIIEANYAAEIAAMYAMDDNPT